MNLAAEMGKLPEPVTNKKPPYWEFWRWDLWTRAQADDPRNFLRWPCIYHTMSQNHWIDAIEFERAYVQRHLVETTPIRAVEEVDRWRDWEPMPGTHRRNLIHQTYHILRWQESTGLNIADMESIYEFGGGYGAMALVCNRLGFKGRYYIYDLPEFSLLQQWYLEECGVGNVEWVDSAAHGDVDLLIACYSLSETDYAERTKMLDAWPAKSYLFLYSNKFEDYDNIGYFQTLDYGLNLPRRWAHSHLDHLPPESWYTWGW